jgi:biofilm PGA synthesis N-glycosyltransferase PgaC
MAAGDTVHQQSTVGSDENGHAHLGTSVLEAPTFWPTSSRPDTAGANRRTAAAESATQTSPAAVTGSEIGRVAVASGLLMVAGGITAVGNIAFHTIVAHSGGTDAYGAIGALLSFATVASFLGAGIQYAVARTTSLSSAEPGVIMRHAKLALLPWLLLSCGLCAASGRLAAYLHLSSPVPVILAVAYFMLMVVVTVPAGVLVGRRRFGTYAALVVAAVGVRLCLGVLFERSGDPTEGAILASVVAAAVMVVGTTTAALRSRPTFSPLLEGRVSETEGDAHLAGEGVVSAILAGLLWGVWSLPLLFSQHLLSSTSAADFAAAQLMASAILLAAAPLTTAFFPSIARTQSARTILVGLGATVAVSTVCAIIVSFAGPAALPHLYGRQFSTSYRLLIAFSLSAVPLASVTYLLWVVRALRRSITPTAVGITTAFVAELIIGSTFNSSPDKLAVGPGFAVALGMAIAFALALRPARQSAPVMELHLRGVPTTYRAPRLRRPSDAASLLSSAAVGMMVHNEEATVEKCLRAILQERDGQSAVSSVVVITSGCTDASEDIVRSLAAVDSRVRLIIQGRREGKAAAINLFLSETTEPICALVGGDTLLGPGALTALVDVLRDPQVGMSGARIVPVNPRKGVVANVVHLLWELHHEVAIHRPKLGEAIAFRRAFDRIDTASLADEVSIEAEIRAAGCELRYVPDAIVFNHGPETLGDYLAQRMRIHLGHLGVRASTGYSPATMRIRTVGFAAARTLRRQPGRGAFVAVAIALEAVARWRADLTFLIRGTPTEGVWQPIATAKRPFEPMDLLGLPAAEHAGEERSIA